MGETTPEVCEYPGTYPNSDARILLDALVSAGIEYTPDIDKMSVEAMPAIQAADDGTSGAGTRIAIGVHVDDMNEAIAIRQRVFKITL